MANATMAGAPNRVNHTALNRIGFGVHRDDFTIQDHLGRRQLVEAIAELVAKDVAPMVLGLHGDWGAGKTSALRAIRYILTGENPHGESVQDDEIPGRQYEDRVVTVWFEAWRYQNELSPVVALIQEMRRQLSLWYKARRQVSKIAAVTFESLLDSLDKAAKLIGLETLPISAKDIRTSGERYERERLEQALPTDSIQEFLQQAIEGLLPEQKAGLSKPRVVVFIDDLDRCSAESAYRLLEGLKIYLQLTNCVFVLGMNQQIVVEALAERLKKDDSDRSVLVRAEAYLEKLCSNIWRLPLPSDPVVYFENLVDRDDSRASITAARAGDPTRSWAACPRFLPPNPRRLRALANVYNRLRNAADNLVDGFSTDLHLRLLFVSYIYQFHGELFQRWHYDANFLLSMKSWLRATPGATELAADDPFARLSLPTLFTANTSSATPGSGIESRYPDPSAPGVFWIAPLLQTTLWNTQPDEYKALLSLLS